ncbi:MAG: response regulator [Ilumatobacteraceae bacterium]
MIRVLVVDDHPAILRHVGSWVRGTEVAEVVGTTSNPVAVPALWEELRPDVTLCDVHMPVMDGLELCARLRESYPEAAVVLFSARDDRTTRDAATAAGAVGLVPKTASVEELAAMLRLAGRQ